MKTFTAIFDTHPTTSAEAPGRVNPLGEQTDYNDGYVLPTAVPQSTRVMPRPNHQFRYHAHADRQQIQRTPRRMRRSGKATRRARATRPIGPEPDRILVPTG